MLRRNFNLSTFMGMSALTFSPSISIAQDKKKDKAVLWIWLGGGISHIETFNPLPNAPLEYRSMRGHINTRIGEIGGDFQSLAKLSDELTIVRSFNHRDNNHDSATHWVMTGEPNFRSQSQMWPSMGSVTLHKYGTNDKKTGIPLYVRTSKINGDEGAFLGGKYKGYEVNLQGVKDLYLDIPEDRFKNRLKVIEAIEGKNSIGMMKEYSELREQAVEVITGTAAKAFRLDEENQDTHKKFKTESKFGKDSLLSIRLLQNGVKFVTLSNNGWDMHEGLNQGFERKAPELDYILAVIIDELKKRDLYDSTLIVMATEFGRTPRIDGKTNGRHHWGTVNNLLFAGGGYAHGRIIGKTDSLASVVEDNPFSSKDLVKTVLNHLNIDAPYGITGTDNRPHLLIEPNAKNILESV